MIWSKKIDAILIQEDASFDRLYEVLDEMKNENVDKEFAYELLKQMRLRNYTEKQDDLLFELMDIVSGFCSPHLRLWD